MEVQEFKKMNEEIRRSKGLVISRLPEPTRSEFIKLAEDHFAGDYGMLLLTIFEDFKKNVLFYQNTEIKLNYIVQLLEGIKDKNEPQVETEQKPKGVYNLAGQRIA